MLMKRLEDWILSHPDRPVVAVEDFQLQVEHTLDLVKRDLVLFVDASASGPAPVALHRVTPGVDFSFSTHALSPPSLLQAFITLDRGTPPPAFSLAVRGYAFGLGESLSPQAATNLEHAWALLERLLERASEAAWEELRTYDASPPHLAHRFTDTPAHTPDSPRPG